MGVSRDPTGSKSHRITAEAPSVWVRTAGPPWGGQSREEGGREGGKRAFTGVVSTEH